MYVLHFYAFKIECERVSVRTIGIIGFSHLLLNWLELTCALFHSQENTLQEYAMERQMHTP